MIFPATVRLMQIGSSRLGLQLRLATDAGSSRPVAGLAGLLAWLVPTLADRDLSFQDQQVISGRGSAPTAA
jgi:hypothetical protein